MAAATEYNSDATKAVDYTTDPGLEGGDNGGKTAARGMLEKAVVRKKLHMGTHSKKTSKQKRSILSTSSRRPPKHNEQS